MNDYDFTKDDSHCWKEMLEEIEAPTKEELQQKIDKAIEYIEHHRWCDISDFDDNYKEIVTNADKVLEILKGSDKE